MCNSTWGSEPQEGHSLADSTTWASTTCQVPLQGMRDTDSPAAGALHLGGAHGESQPVGPWRRSLRKDSLNSSLKLNVLGVERGYLPCAQNTPWSWKNEKRKNLVDFE